MCNLFYIRSTYFANDYVDIYNVENGFATVLFIVLHRKELRSQLLFIVI